MTQSVKADAVLERVNSAPELCVSHGRPIQIMAFRGTGFCSVECRKLAGDDVSSVGTIMFVTLEEQTKIMEARKKKANPKRKRSIKKGIRNG